MNETTQEKDRDKKSTYRLTDMVVESVDLVDRAANKRRFLLVKREDADMKVKQTQDQGEVINVIVADPESGVESTQKAAGKVCETCGKDPCECEKEKKSDDKKVEDDKKAEAEEKAKAAVVCPKCGYEGAGKMGDKCPKCGTAMDASKKAATEEKASKPKSKEEMEEEEKAKKKPSKDDDMPEEEKKAARTDEERAMSHFKLSKEEWDKLSKEKKDEYIGKLPSRGSGGTEKGSEEENLAKGDSMVCPKCGATMPKPPNYKGGDFKCPKCDGMMKPKSGEDKEKSSCGDKDKDKEKEEKSKDKEKDEEKEEMDKAMPKPVQVALLSAMREGTERLMSVVSVLRSATVTQEQSSAPLPNKIFGEIEAVKTLLSSIVQRYPAPTSKSDAEVDECVRGLLKQGVSLPGAVRDAVVEKIRGVLEKLLSTMRTIREHATTDDKTERPMPAGIANAMKACASELESITSKYPSPSSKSSSMLTDLKRHLDGINEIVTVALNGAPLPEISETKKADASKDEQIAALNKRLDEVTAALKDLSTKRLPGSNAADADGLGELKKNNGYKWPMDLAEGIK